jgi:hypothetical protein
MFVRLDHGFLRRESECGQEIADGTRSHLDAECFLDHIGDDVGSPTFVGIASSDGTAENDLFELLFWLVGETWNSS